MTDLHKLTDDELNRKIREAIIARDAHLVASVAAKERSEIKRPNEEGGKGSLITYPSSTNLASKTWHDEKIVKLDETLSLINHAKELRSHLPAVTAPTELALQTEAQRIRAETELTLMRDAERLRAENRVPTIATGPSSVLERLRRARAIQLAELSDERRKAAAEAEAAAKCKSNKNSCVISGGAGRRRTVRSKAKSKSTRRYKKKATQARRHRRSRSSNKK